MASIMRPFKQGQLDGMCSLYALINAIRLSLADEERRYRRSDWEDLFYELLCVVDDDHRTMKVVTSGMTSTPFGKLAWAAVNHMRDAHEAKVSIDRLLAPGTRPRMTESIERIRQSANNGHPVIVCFSGGLNHWTVVRRVGHAHLLLFDSSKHHRLRLANCRMSYEPRFASPQYIIHTSGMWAVSANASP